MDKQQKIENIRVISEKITQSFLKEDKMLSISNKYEYLVSIFALHTKQTNLIQSILVLLNNNMASEANLLFRSLINIYMLIVYLSNDDKDHNRLKEYKIQPLRNELSFLYNTQFAIKQGWIKKEDLSRFKTLNKKIRNVKNQLEKEGFPIDNNKRDLRPFGILELANKQRELSLIYYTYYTQSSKYEHSDVSVLYQYVSNYQEIDNNINFQLVSYLDDPELDEMVLNMSAGFYFKTFFYIYEHIKKDNIITWDEDTHKELAVISLMIGQIQGIILD